MTKAHKQLMQEASAMSDAELEAWGNVVRGQEAGGDGLTAEAEAWRYAIEAVVSERSSARHAVQLVQSMDYDKRQRFLADIIITAVEGGTGYWASVSAYKHDCPADQTTATIHDEEDPTSKYVLTTRTIADGIARVLDPGFKINSGLRETIARASLENGQGRDDIDADAADVIVQAACFGAITYG